MTDLSAHYTTLITDVDNVLKVVGPIWLEARDEEKRKHMIRVNELLDQRIALMAKRDAVAEIKP